MATLGTPPTRVAVIFHGALTVSLAGLAWGFSGPVPDLGWLVGAGTALLTLVVFWLVFLPARLHARAWSWLAPTPLLIVATAVLIAVGIPANARWTASRPAFDHAVAALAGGRALTHVGSFRVTNTTAVPGGYVFAVDSRWLGDAGFAYLPQGPTADLADSQGVVFVHLEGPWYRWTATE